MPGRSAATMIGTGSRGTRARRKPLIENVSYSSTTFSPVSALRTNRNVSRTRWYGRSNSMAFQRSTITFDDDPMPSTKRPGAASAMLAVDPAISAGPRVYTGTIAVPKRSVDVHCDARANGGHDAPLSFMSSACCSSLQ